MEIPVPLFFVGFAAIAGYFVFRLIKYGGLRGALYGSAIARTIGEVELSQVSGVKHTLRVHVLENGRIVLEQSSRTMLSASLHGLPMTTDDADRLVSLLQQART